MLIYAYEEVASLARLEASQAFAAWEIHDLVKGDLDRAQQLHKKILYGLRMASEVLISNWTRPKLIWRKLRQR